MAAVLVVDASVALKWLQPEADSEWLSTGQRLR